MLLELQELVKRIIQECEDPSALDAEDMTYLKQIKSAADLMNFEDDDKDKMHSLAMSAAKTIGQSPAWIAQKDAEQWQRKSEHRHALSVAAHRDFDKGFGIGGLGRHVEPITVPTIKAIEKMERIEREMEVCRQCGASNIIDGAMFTTIAGSGYCDDCC